MSLPEMRKALGGASLGEEGVISSSEAVYVKFETPTRYPRGFVKFMGVHGRGPT